MKLEKTYTFSNSDCDVPQTKANKLACDGKTETKPADFSADADETAEELEAGPDVNLQTTTTTLDPDSTLYKDGVNCNQRERITEINVKSDNDQAEALEAENLDHDSHGTMPSSNEASESNSDNTIDGIPPPYLYFIVRTCGKGSFVMVAIGFTLAFHAVQPTEKHTTHTHMPHTHPGISSLLHIACCIHANRKYISIH